MDENCIIIAAAVLLLAFSFGCLSSAPPAMRTLEFSARNLSVPVEMAVTPEQISTGLMGRTNLDENGGMLFDMGSGHNYRPSFYMFRTTIPLDAIFLDENLSVVDIQSMAPCLSDEPRACPSYTSRAPASFVLEVNGGFAARNGIKIGDKASLD